MIELQELVRHVVVGGTYAAIKLFHIFHEETQSIVVLRQLDLDAARIGHMWHNYLMSLLRCKLLQHFGRIYFCIINNVIFDKIHIFLLNKF